MEKLALFAIAMTGLALLAYVVIQDRGGAGKLALLLAKIVVVAMLVLAAIYGVSTV